MTPLEPHPASRRRRLVAAFFIGLAGLVLLAVGLDGPWRRGLGWGAFDLGGLNQIAGAALALAGLALVIESVKVQYTLGQGTPVPLAATRQLVTAGPYAWTRNPMTLGALDLYLGLGLGLGSGLILGLTALVFTGLLTYIYIHETRELGERFGEAYHAYRRRTPFLIPRRPRP